MADITIKIVEHTLSDGSVVHNVTLRGEGGNKIELLANDERSAAALAAALCDVINYLTVTTVAVR